MAPPLGARKNCRNGQKRYQGKRLIREIERWHSNNGHAKYYRGEIVRFMRLPRYDLRFRDHFFSYLDAHKDPSISGWEGEADDLSDAANSVVGAVFVMSERDTCTI
jgi:hypothetical protein